MSVIKYSESGNHVTTLDFDGGSYRGTENSGAMGDILESDAANEYAKYVTIDNLESTETQKPLSANQGKVLNDRKEDKSNKVTSFQATPDDMHYPSEKLVKDSLDAVEGRVDETQASLLTTKLAVNELERQAQIGNGATLDFSGIGTVPLDARATGRANPTVEGLTVTNLVENGDFSNGTTRWISEYGADISVTNRILTQIGDTTKSNQMVYQNIVLASGTFVVARARVRNTTSSLRFRFLNGGVYFTEGTVIPNPIIDQWYTLSAVLTQSSSIIGIQRNMSTGTQVDLEIDGNYGVMAFNLTSIFGASNEPSEADCAKIFSYFDGTKSISMPARLRSVGKNLFQPLKSTSDYRINTFGGSSNFTYGFDTDTSFKFDASGQYSRLIIEYANLHAGDKITFRLDARCTGDYKKFEIRNSESTLLVSSLTITTIRTIYYKTITVPSDGYIQIIFYNTSTGTTGTWETYSFMMLRGEDTTFSYEPYTYSTLYIADNEELRSIQDVSDTVEF